MALEWVLRTWIICPYGISDHPPWWQGPPLLVAESTGLLLSGPGGPLKAHPRINPTHNRRGPFPPRASSASRSKPGGLTDTGPDLGAMNKVVTLGTLSFPVPYFLTLCPHGRPRIRCNSYVLPSSESLWATPASVPSPSLGGMDSGMLGRRCPASHKAGKLTWMTVSWRFCPSLLDCGCLASLLPSPSLFS